MEGSKMRLQVMRAVTILLTLAAVSAPAAEVLDQQNDVSPSATADSTSGGVLVQVQTFTVGVSGTLSRIAVQINYPGFGLPGNAILNVYNTAGGLPNAILGSASLPNSAIPSGGYAFQSFDVSSYAIPVHVGDVLAYGVTSTLDSYFFLRSTFDHSTYAGGQSYYNSSVTGWTAYSPTHDGGFQTYVLASAAGLPGDFDNNGKVDAGDYAIWRKNNGTSNALANDNGLGVPIGSSHYNLWRVNFGKPPGAGSGLDGAAVPEPSSVALIVLSVCCAQLRRRRA
jgi:hypothetical protein